MRSRRFGSSWVWLAALAMLAQALAPALRGRHLEAAGHAPHVVHCPAHGSTDPAPLAPHHDEATCEVCKTIAAGHLATIDSGGLVFVGPAPVGLARSGPELPSRPVTTPSGRTSRGPPAHA